MADLPEFIQPEKPEEQQTKDQSSSLFSDLKSALANFIPDTALDPLPETKVPSVQLIDGYLSRTFLAEGPPEKGFSIPTSPKQFQDALLEEPRKAGLVV